MPDGTVFDIKEFALHDGPGLRTAVFLKGCPLRCEWCHNPEGQSFPPELVKNKSSCAGCGLCERGCRHPGCAPWGVCLKVCPNNCLKIAGRRMTARELADRLLRNESFLRKGGVTFSGGEPLCQSDFILEVQKLLGGIPVAVETCGCVAPEIFKKAASAVEHVYMDIKLIDRDEHIRRTGRDNGVILENAAWLAASGYDAVFRVPLIPGVTDTDSNLSGIAEFLSGYHPVSVELIPYNRLTGAKYRSVGREYSPSFDEALPPNRNTAVFESRGILCRAY